MCNFVTEYMDIGAAHRHLDSISRWKTCELPVFQDMVDSRSDKYVHAFLDKFDLRGATRECRYLPSERKDVEFSAKRRLDQMKHSLHVLTPVFKRFSAYLNWKSFFHQMVDKGEYEKAIAHLDSKPGWGDTKNHGEGVKNLYFLYLRKSIAWDRIFSIEEELATPLVPIEEPLLSELKVAVLPLIRAENVLKRFLQKSLIYTMHSSGEKGCRSAAPAPPVVRAVGAASVGCVYSDRVQNTPARGKDF